MPNSSLSLQAAIAEFDQASATAKLTAASEQRSDGVERFPITEFGSMDVSAYALGLPDSKQGYSYWLEWGSNDLGSVSGGSAGKHLIFRHSEGEWRFPTQYISVDEAWAAVRAGFVELFERAAAGQWQEIDEIESLQGGAAIRGKTAFVYFPDELLPIYSAKHLEHWAKLFEVKIDGLQAVGQNRRIFEAVTSMPEFSGWAPLEIMHFLYQWAPPGRKSVVLKVEPGPDAGLWEDCLKNGRIRVDGSGIGDLSLFSAVGDLAVQLGKAPDTSKSAAERAAKGLEHFRALVPGDVVVANRGTEQVLGIGTVTSGYEFTPELPDYRHVAHIEWDESKACEVAFGSAWNPVIRKLTAKEYKEVVEASDTDAAGSAAGEEPPEVPDIHFAAQNLLERNGQIVFFGPPGTGKTYSARRHAVWLLGGGPETPEAAHAFGSSSNLAELESVYIQGGEDVARLTRVTFHPTYSYEDFVEGYKPSGTGNSGLELEMRDGIFKRVCDAAAENPNDSYVVLIDEINRGNVPKVFGELITLIERDKRGVAFSLPQSGAKIVVPPNVFTIATMNTADRSIHVLDVALRRRFGFIELLPDPSVLAGASIGALSLDDFLAHLNARVRDRIGREKQVGHAVLMDSDAPISSFEQFALAFRYELLPLLQEYTYGDYRDLADLLGEEIIDRVEQTVIAEVVEDPELLIAALVKNVETD